MTQSEFNRHAGTLAGTVLGPIFAGVLFLSAAGVFLFGIRWANVWKYMAGVLSVLLIAGAALPFDATPQPISADGTRAVIDLPAGQHMRNVGGSDGSGLCVFTSVQNSAYWQNVRELDGFRAWMQKRPGGGWPQKLDQCFAQFAKEKGAGVPAYIQHTGGDESFLELALKTDRMPSVTYDGRDGFYRGQIAHMVNLAHLDNNRAAIIDNNRPGVWVWMTRPEFLSRWRGNSGGWAVVLLADPPPPIPEAVQAFGAAPCVCGDSCTCAKGDCPGKCPVVAGQCQGGRCPLPSAPISSDTGSDGAVRTVSGAWIAPNGDGTYRYVSEPGAPTAAPVVGSDALNHGVDPSKIHAAPTYSLNGSEVTKREAERILAGADGLKDDSDRWHLTGVGDAVFQVRFRADVALLPVDVRSKLLVQTYGPDAWPVSQYKLPAGVSLRKPSPVRTAAEVGAIPPTEYTAAKLGGLLSLPGGPVPAPKLPPEPTPDPKPSAPKQPDAAPVAPKPDPTPAAPSNTLLYVLLAALAGWVLSRRMA